MTSDTVKSIIGQTTDSLFNQTVKPAKTATFNPKIRFFKRLIDLVLAGSLLLICLPLMLLIACAIKVSTRGNIFYCQQRIGLATPNYVEFFIMYKFRTMVENAEQSSGAVLATTNDVRVTALGRFLRKARLDELPQLINVLRGDMSIVGPRPERPEFYQKLEDEIPFFAERTFMIQPGITGLAQINQGYDTCIDDVRKKLAYDHSYALSLFTIIAWLKMDCHIMLKTFVVMITGRGQ